MVIHYIDKWDTECESLASALEIAETYERGNGLPATRLDAAQATGETQDVAAFTSGPSPLTKVVTQNAQILAAMQQTLPAMLQLMNNKQNTPVPHLGPTDRQLDRFGWAKIIEVKPLYQTISPQKVETLAMTRSHKNSNNSRQVLWLNRMYKPPPHSLRHSNKFRICEMALVATPVSSSVIRD